MGTPKKAPHPNRASLADALFPKVRQRVLAVLFDAPERSFYMGEVIAQAQSGTGAVQRELVGLAAVGILSVHRQGKQKHYQANPASPVFDAILSLVSQTMGIANVLRAALAPLARQVQCGFVYNESRPARGSAMPAVNVVLFGSLLADAKVSSAVEQALQTAANTMGRQLSFSLYTPDTLERAVAQSSHFRKRLLQPSKTWLVGNENDLFKHQL